MTEILSMSGMCRNGFERDSGRLFHAVPGNKRGWTRAVCGATPGKRGNGWSETPGAKVTCPRCLKKLAAK
jgi:hypothetical protein